MSDSPAWILATPADAPVVGALLREFYAEEKLPYTEAVAVRVVAELLGSPATGAIFLCRAAGESLGYVVATFACSLEFGGRYVLLDELYLRPAARGRGEGKRAIACVEAWAIGQGVSTLRLEVNHHNAKALSVYLKSGFTDDQRHLLSKRLTP